MRKIALAILFASVACALVEAGAAGSSLERLEGLFLEENYAKTVSEADRLIALTGSAPEKEELHYLKALALIKEGRFRDSRNCFEGMLLGFPRGRRLFDAKVGIGDTYYLEGDYAAAIRIYEDIMKEYPDKANMAIVYYRLGECYRSSGIRDKADAFFERVREAAPLSFEAKMAPAEYFSVQVGAFKSKANAERLARDLPRAYGERYVETGSSSGRGGALYKVRIGRRASREDALALAAKLKKNGYETKICP